MIAKAPTPASAAAPNYLFVLCMLRTTGAPDTVFTRITEHGEFRWLASALQDAPA